MIYPFSLLRRLNLDFSNCEIRVLSPEGGVLARAEKTRLALDGLKARGWGSPRILPTLAGWSTSIRPPRLAVVEGRMATIVDGHLVYPGRRKLRIGTFPDPPRKRFPSTRQGE